MDAASNVAAGPGRGSRRWRHLLAPADSMAWSCAARREPPLPGCTSHKNCANCLRYATRWRARILAGLAGRGRQDSLFDTAGTGDAA